MRKSSVFLGIAFLFYPAISATPPLAASESEEPAALLRNCLQAQSINNHISFRVRTEMLFDTGDAQPRQQRDERWFRRDQERLDVSGCYSFLDKSQDQSYKYRAVINKELSVAYSYHPNRSAGPTKGVASTAVREEFERYAGTLSSSLMLDGYSRFSGGKSLPEAMLEAGTGRLMADESIAGTDCKVVEARTKFGSATLWISPAKGYTILKSLLKKGPDDVLEDGPLREQPRFHSWDDDEFRKQWSLVADQVEVAQHGTAYVPVRGRAVETTELSSGTKRVVELSYIRSDVRTDYEDSDAFTTDLPDGSEVTNLQDAQSGLVYQWRGGRVITSYHQPVGNASTEFEPRSNLTMVLWGLAAAAGLACGIALLFRARLLKRPGVRQ